MIVLGIESSCDECSAAVVDDHRNVLSLKTASQIQLHAEFEGVVPEVASRAHAEAIDLVVADALRAADVVPNQLDGVAATNRPGLSGSLAVGLSFAKGFAVAADIPFLAVDHMLSHAYAVQLVEPVSYPYVVLLVSGGHTLVGVSRSAEELEVWGATIDDACGEAYDKVSGFLGIGYPGGPAIDMLAKSGDPRAFAFPQPRLNRANPRYDFSYSGLKTAVFHQLDKFWNRNYPKTKENVAAAFQKAAVDQLVSRLNNVVEDSGVNTLTVGGGVAANSHLRARLRDRPQEMEHYTVVLPPVELCTDNGAMVAALGVNLLQRGYRSEPVVGVQSRVPDFRRHGV